MKLPTMKLARIRTARVFAFFFSWRNSDAARLPAEEYFELKITIVELPAAEFPVSGKYVFRKLKMYYGNDALH